MVQSIASVLTIPLTSAVCSSVVVIYLQHRADARAPNFTLRQMMVLADKGWTDVGTYFRLASRHRPLREYLGGRFPHRLRYHCRGVVYPAK